MNQKNSLRSTAALFILIGCLAAGLGLPSRTPGFKLFPSVRANSTYCALGTSGLNLSITTTSTNQITTNDDWSAISCVEGYFGQNLTATHGIDPQTVLNTEFANNQLPNTPTQVHANKGNPSAFSAGGVAEFDQGTYLAVGFQGNVQANPYLVFYVNTMNRQNVRLSYQVQDIDSGSNNSVSPLALQYRVGESGLFTNVPSAFISDATDGGVAGRITTRNVTLPAAVDNQPKVQIRLITTNAANSSGGSSPDEWMGINNVVVASSSTTAADVNVGGRVVSSAGRGVRGVQVTLTDGLGNVQTAVTGSFGYFHFSGIQAGQTCIIAARSKRFTFPEPVQTLSVMDDTNGILFIAHP